MVKILSMFFMFLSASASADCWVAGELIGKSATSFEGYSFTDDSFKAGMVICFEGDSGSVTGNDLTLVRVGESTLLGLSTTEDGLEVVNTYQIDRANNKLLFTQTRIGTKAITSLLPDYAAVFVADVRRR